jgi:hypothetical protein
VGAALAFLLDALGVDGWRTDVQQGLSPDVLIARFLGAGDYAARLESYSTPRPCT